MQSKEFIDKVNETIDFANHRYISLNPANKWEMIKHAKWAAAKRKAEMALNMKKIKYIGKKLAMIYLSSQMAISHITKIR